MARIISEVVSANIDHNNLADLTVGDDHTQYALLAGRATPQQLAFGNASGAATGYLTSTAHATKGKYFLNSAGTITVDELNSRLGIGLAVPTTTLEMRHPTSAFLKTTEAAIGFDGRFGVDATGVQIGSFVNSNLSFITNTIKRWDVQYDGDLILLTSTAKLDLSVITAGSPNLKITATSDTPTVAFTGGGNAPTTAPEGYLEILVGATSRYIPFWA